MLKPYIKHASTTLTPAAIQTHAIQFNAPYFTPVDCAAIYNIPIPSAGQKVVGVVSLGGGLLNGTLVPTSNPSVNLFTNGDIQRYWAKMDITDQPTICIVSVDGAVNNPNMNDNGATIENTLDVTTVGACCPTSKLTILLYLAPPTLQGFYNMFNMAINNSVTYNGITVQPSIISCSWGLPEPQAVSIATRMNNLFQIAVSRGINICCATGDNGASNGLSGLNVDFPSSSPYVVACGGTNLVCPTHNYASATETAWVNGGGGISAVFAPPCYQARLGAPKRVTPDIAMVADPSSGVVYCFGADDYRAYGGTSIVAPMFAGFLAATGQTTFINQHLYSLPANSFHDIRSGNNGGYNADIGYDRTTGLGSINGVVLNTNIRQIMGLSMSPAQLAKGSTVTLVPTISPPNATNALFVWSSSIPSVATVSTSGAVTGLNPGISTITASTFDGRLSATTTVTVVSVTIKSSSNVAITNISLARNASYTLRVAVLPSNMSQAVTWRSNNPSCVSVTNGVLRGLTKGTAVITAQSSVGAASVTVTVR